jgi:hypothetical protein
MTEQEISLYRQIRNVPPEKSLAAGKSAMNALLHQRFKAEVAAQAESTARVEPVHKAMREALQANPAFAGVQKALAQARQRRSPMQLPPLHLPPAPKIPRLKMGSVHLVDTPPFQAQTWQECSFTGGIETESDDVVVLTADGKNGNMSFNIAGGGVANDNASTVSCSAAVGQAYIMPPGLGKEETSGAFCRFSANPSFNWNANWGSDLWRLASGHIWIGQLVNRFDADWTFLDNPISTQITLFRWHDHSFADAPNHSGENSAYGLSSWIFVQPNFNYIAWVWIGASAFGDAVDAGWSSSGAVMSANCSQLILDTF